MNRCLVLFLVFVVGLASGNKVFGLGVDFTKAELAQFGKHCVHGYTAPSTSVTFFAGDTSNLNEHISKLLLAGNGQGTPVYTTKKIILHIGPKKAGSPWDQKERDIGVDWSVTSWSVSGAKVTTAASNLQIDIWLGSQIKLDELRVPDDFEVVSGGEIEKFIASRKPNQK
jgi:hypothetical protein